MKEFVDKFQMHLITERYVSEHTVEAYRSDVLQFVQFLISKSLAHNFHEVTLQHIKEFLKYIRYTLKLSPRTSSRKLSALKTFSDYLHRFHEIPLFTKGSIFPKLPKHLPKHISSDQVQAIIIASEEDETAVGVRNKVIICLLYACGMRVSELTNLQIQNINFEESYIQVLGKGQKERITPVPEELLALLSHYVTVIHPQLTSSSKATTTILFPVVFGKKIKSLTRQTVCKIIKQLAQNSGLIHSISPHILRHSLATHLLKKGANLRVLQTLLGHEKLTTVQVYTHVDTSHLRKLYDQYHPRAK